MQTRCVNHTRLTTHRNPIAFLVWRDIFCVRGSGDVHTIAPRYIMHATFDQAYTQSDSQTTVVLLAIFAYKENISYSLRRL